MVSFMVGILHGSWLWIALNVAVGTVDSVVSQMNSTTVSVNPLMSSVTRIYPGTTPIRVM